MAEIETITVPELNTGILTPDSYLPFSLPGGELKKVTALEVAGLLAQPITPVFSNSSIFEA